MIDALLFGGIKRTIVIKSMQVVQVDSLTVGITPVDPQRSIALVSTGYPSAFMAGTPFISSNGSEIEVIGPTGFTCLVIEFGNKARTFTVSSSYPAALSTSRTLTLPAEVRPESTIVVCGARPTGNSSYFRLDSSISRVSFIDVSADGTTNTVQVTRASNGPGTDWHNVDFKFQILEFL